jgi:hypothetical protein
MAYEARVQSSFWSGEQTAKTISQLIRLRYDCQGLLKHSGKVANVNLLILLQNSEPPVRNKMS